jgi:hypothetical protein
MKEEATSPVGLEHLATYVLSRIVKFYSLTQSLGPIVARSMRRPHEVREMEDAIFAESCRFSVPRDEFHANSLSISVYHGLAGCVPGPASSAPKRAGRASISSLLINPLFHHALKQSYASTRLSPVANRPRSGDSLTSWA